ncbi:MAG: LicD family protein [Gammaproteobacteria bacterium]|nr:LicD family protein [Gammaproteobacteria bacterium]
MDSSDVETAALMDQLERTIPPMNVRDGERLLRESKQIFDKHGVAFFLRQGTCLGAVRDHALIPWDDDLDLGSIIDMHGFTEDLIGPTVESFRENGCYVEVLEEGLYTAVKIFKYRIRIDWQCYRVVKGTIAHYPGVPFPISLFTELSEVDFLGDTFLVPSPPEEYLRYKYGPNWKTPKQVGYEKDVLDNMPKGVVPGRAGWLKQFLAVHFSPGQTATLLVLDLNDKPVPRADVLIAGLNRSRTNRQGYAKFYLPGADNYAVAVTANGKEEVLYEESMAPGKMYVYRPDATQCEGRYFILTEA